MDSGPKVAPWTHRVVKDVGGKALWSIEKLIIRGSKVGDAAFFETSALPSVRILEDNWRVIRSELDTVLKNLDNIPNFQDISTDQVSITRDDRWKTFFLYGMGYRSEKNCEKCPETTRLVESIPGMTTALFSILTPGKHIPPHRGLYKGLLRVHLGLIIPEPAEKCRIRVESEVRHWEEGKCMVFDDTFEHEVWNDTDGIRVVLFLDVKRPLSFATRGMNDAILGLVRRSSYVTDARRNQEMWDKQLEAKLGDIRARTDGKKAKLVP